MQTTTMPKALVDGNITFFIQTISLEILDVPLLFNTKSDANINHVLRYNPNKMQ